MPSIDDRREPVDAVDRARGLVDAEAGDGAERAAGAVGQVERGRGEVLERLPVVGAEREAHLDLAVVGAELLQRVAAHRDGDRLRHRLRRQPEARGTVAVDDDLHLVLARLGGRARRVEALHVAEPPAPRRRDSATSSSVDSPVRRMLKAPV